jgi:hypothetical protein
MGRPQSRCGRPGVEKNPLPLPGIEPQPLGSKNERNETKKGLSYSRKFLGESVRKEEGRER